LERILLLNDSQFPNGFNSVIVTQPAGMTKIAYTEKRMLAAINQYNPKLDVTRIEYLAIENQFSNYKKGKSNGVLVEEFDIDPALASIYRANGCYVYSTDSRCLCRRIMMYVFISEVNEETRTALISQTVFPTLLDYAEEYMKSPSYTIANHKFCFINILNKTLTAKMILRHLASLCAVGMDYIEVFENGSIDVNQIPKDLKAFLRVYASNFTAKYNEKTDIYEDDNYMIEFFEKKFIWKASPMAATKIIHKTATTVDFSGSSEKFYWIETLPMAVFAYNQGYKVDYSDYSNFIATYRSQFSNTSKKFARCEVLLEYIEKYFI
jgi:hypothetical protein